MPNGGSDCCGTCWFNQKNKGEAGYSHAKKDEPDFCLIRDISIDCAFWTYCANHPHHNREKIEVPIGQVYVCAEDSYRRVVSVESPDTEVVRQELIKLAEEIREQPREEYPAGLYFDESVVTQLGKFREIRARDAIERIAAFNPKSRVGTPAQRTRESLVKIAQKALEKIDNKS